MNTNTHHTQHSLNQPTQQTPLLKRSLPTISIISPIIVCLLLESYSIPYSTPLKLIIPLPPFLYSGIQYLIIFNNNRREQSVSPSTLSSALHSLTNISLLLFSLISLLSIIALAIDTWDEHSYAFLIVTISPLQVIPPYLLSISSKQSTLYYSPTTTVDILLDLTILLTVPASIAAAAFINHSPEHYLLTLIVLSAILIQLRSYTETYTSQKTHNTQNSRWRQAIPIITLLIAASLYAITAYADSHILRQNFIQHTKNLQY
ncbi:DUF2463 domain-containing protein [Encephalitozoon hellem]|uniref:DUF2463 domain-containing protein n=1 Tax=Encephalitozoon hellem TaxID=27973 RepID=A0ABY8CKY1_ENCHE|nr:DUF2463 domain-containing protein [Encephalitozoon hellem]WEL38326.1 DUF2463 domain-containing protein [Encephalitozoon hellem]WEL38527.1 DUF2463 domain-containing protein [Encephalitozoon hellem]